MKDLKIQVSIETVQAIAKEIRELYPEVDLSDVEDIQIYMWYLQEVKNK